MSEQSDRRCPYCRELLFTVPVIDSTFTCANLSCALIEIRIDEEMLDYPHQPEGSPIPLPELPDDSPHVEYWDDVEEVCEVAKAVYVGCLICPTDQRINVDRAKLVPFCFELAESYTKFQRQYKTNAANEYRKRETQRSKQL